jgi:hypothetical protein
VQDILPQKFSKRDVDDRHGPNRNALKGTFETLNAPKGTFRALADVPKPPGRRGGQRPGDVKVPGARRRLGAKPHTPPEVACHPVDLA